MTDETRSRVPHSDEVSTDDVGSRKPEIFPLKLLRMKIHLVSNHTLTEQLCIVLQNSRSYLPSILFTKTLGSRSVLQEWFTWKFDSKLHLPLCTRSPPHPESSVYLVVSSVPLPFFDTTHTETDHDHRFDIYETRLTSRVTTTVL